MKPFSLIMALVAFIAISIFLSSAIFNAIEDNYAKGFDDGAMHIINEIVKGRNIAYNALDGTEYKIELFTESVNWYEHEPGDTECSACHKYSIEQSLMKGGEGK